MANITLPTSKVESILSGGLSFAGRHRQAANQIDWLMSLVTDILPPDTCPEVYSRLLQSLVDDWPIGGPNVMIVGHKISDAIVHFHSLGADPLYAADALMDSRTTQIVEDEWGNVVIKNPVESGPSCSFAYIFAWGDTKAFKSAMAKIKRGANGSKKMDQLNHFVTSNGSPLLCKVTTDRGKPPCHADLFSCMLDSGWNVNVTDPDGNTPLHLAKNKADVQLLLDRGAAMDIKNNNGLLPWDCWDSDSKLSSTMKAGMKSSARKHLPGGESALSKKLSASAEDGWFASAMNGTKTGLPTKKEAILNATKKIMGFETPLNLLEVALLGIVYGQKKKLAVRIKPHAFNCIVERDPDDALWTNRARMIALCALLSGVDTIDKLLIYESASKQLNVQHMRGKIINSLEKIGVVAKPNRAQADDNHYFSLSLSSENWECLENTLMSVMECAMLSEEKALSLFNGEIAYSWPAVTEYDKILQKITNKLPINESKIFYNVVAQVGEMSRREESEVVSVNFSTLWKRLVLLAKEKGGPDAVSPETSEAFLRAALGGCCPQQSTLGRTAKARVSQYSPELEWVAEAINTAITSVKNSDNAEKSLAKLAERASEAKAQYIAYLNKIGRDASSKAIQNPNTVVENKLVLKTMMSSLSLALRDIQVKSNIPDKPAKKVKRKRGRTLL